MHVNDDRQAGFFLWETILLSIFLLAMAAAAGMYMRAAQLQSIAAAEGRADYLARAQMSYAQAVLDRDGRLPAQMDYLGDAQDLTLNGIVYVLRGEAVSDERGLWQLAVEISWEAKGRAGMQEYKRCLARHK